MKTFIQFHEEAEFLRESSGSTNIEKTLLKALKVLKLFKIPHYVCGGFAVQEHGFARLTVDVNIIVPDVQFAREKLSLNGFKPNRGSKMTVTDRPQILTLAESISLKLSSYIGSPFDRARDYGDVAELIKANRPPRQLDVDSKVQDEFYKIWDGLHPAKG